MVRSSEELLNVLRQLQLLEPAKLEELTRDLQGRSVEPRVLAQQLIEQSWLTPYQANHLLQGRGQELVLGGYVLLERLGEGGMGAVFKARHQKLGRVAALKVIRKERLDSADAVKRFEREVRAAAQLNHPNIVVAFDADQANGVHFMAMEYIEGTDLSKLVKKSGALAVSQACDYIRQAALGLQHAYQQGMVHRDIKPHNLLIECRMPSAECRVEDKGPGSPSFGTRHSAFGNLKILDMGLARVARRDSDEEASSTLTKEGSVMGTLDYIAPEQAMDSHTVDIRADLYSLGCTLYFLLTARVPFPGGDALAKLMKHKLEEPTPIETLRPEVPPAVAAVIRKLMAKNPDDRYTTPAEVAAALQAALANPGTVPTSEQDSSSSSFTAALAYMAGSDTAENQDSLAKLAERRHVRKLLAGAAAVFLVLVGLIGYAVWSSLPQSTPRPAPRTGDTTANKDKAKGKGEVPVVAAGVPPLTIAPFDEKQAQAHQEAWAKYLKREVVETNSIGMKLAVIPPGTFMMGSPADEAGRHENEGPQHEVTISRPFALGIHEVTIGQYRAFIKESGHLNDGDWEKSGATDEHPVTQVTWFDADAFCKWLSQKEGKKYALPTEAQWEYGCRAGSRTRFCFGDDNKQLPEYCWYFANSGGNTHLVGQKKPNAWGLCDMHGNVWEWTADWYKADYYKDNPKQDPPGPNAGTARATRGAACNQNLASVRAAYRRGDLTPTIRSTTLGFRVVCESDGPPQRVVGRYVRIDLPGEQRTLSLAEVEVFSGGVNVARRGKAAQSSTHNVHGADRAIDGNTRGDLRGADFSHTALDTRDPWWELDLGAETPIESIVVWNRTDLNQYKRLDGFTLTVLDGNRRPVFTRAGNPAPERNVRFELAGVVRSAVDDAWVKQVAALPAKEQVEAVREKLRALNPAFDGTVKPKIEGDAVTEFTVIADEIEDISPLRALRRLKTSLHRERHRQGPAGGRVAAEGTAVATSDLWPQQGFGPHAAERDAVAFLGSLQHTDRGPVAP